MWWRRLTSINLSLKFSHICFLSVFRCSTNPLFLIWNCCGQVSSSLARPLIFTKLFIRFDPWPLHFFGAARSRYLDNHLVIRHHYWYITDWKLIPPLLLPDIPQQRDCWLPRGQNRSHGNRRGLGYWRLGQYVFHSSHLKKCYEHNIVYTPNVY